MTVPLAILKANFIGPLAVTSITAFSIFTEAVIITLLPLNTVSVIALFLGPYHELLANGRVASSAPLGVLKAYLCSLAYTINLTWLVSLRETVVIILVKHRLSHI